MIHMNSLDKLVHYLIIYEFIKCLIFIVLLQAIWQNNGEVLWKKYYFEQKKTNWLP